MIEFSLGGFSCRAERIGKEPAALVVLFSGADRKLFCDVCDILAAEKHSLVLAEYGPIDWDNDYTPWTSDTPDGRHFGGGAKRLADFLPTFVGKLAERFGEFSGVYCCGYSLGGLFALYASCIDENISGAASCSGSMWFPNWTDFLTEHPLHGRVYLSLGGKEKNTSDPLMAAIAEKTAEVKRIVGSTAEVTFVQERGGHFSRIPERISRGIIWLLR